MDETRLAELRDFIIRERKQGETYDGIRQQLLASGWGEADVNEYLPTAWQQAEAAAAPAAPPAMPPAMAPGAAPAMPPATAPAQPPAYTPPIVPEAKPVEPLQAPPTLAPAAPPAVVPPAFAPPAEGPAYGIGAWFSRGWAMFSTDAGTIILALLLTGLLGLVTVTICLPPLIVGLNLMLLKKHDGQPIAVGDIFQGFRYFWSAWGVFALTLLATMVISGPVGLAFGGGQEHLGEAMSRGSMIAQGVSTIWSWVVTTFFLFAMPFIADGRGGAIDAISASFNAAKSDFGMYLAMVILAQVVAAAGLLLCVVGIFITAPWSQAALVSVYRSRFPARS